MPILKINAVQCMTPDEIDKDEMYLKMNGDKIWPTGEMYHRLDTGDKVDIGLELEVEEGWNEIELWDFDYVSLNDRLGKFRFKVDHVTGEYSTSMEVLEKNSTAAYLLFWEIAQ